MQGNGRFPGQFVLLDLEYTAWQGSKERGWGAPGEHREIVEIGAIHIFTQGGAFKENGWMQCVVRPVKNPALSEYFSALTGITQADVDRRAYPLALALDVLARFARGNIMFSWGLDRDVIAENCALQGIPNPFRTSRMRDLRPLVANGLRAEGIDAAAYSSGTLVRAFGLAGLRPHRALNDMRNLLRVLQELRARGRI